MQIMPPSTLILDWLQNEIGTKIKSIHAEDFPKINQLAREILANLSPFENNLQLINYIGAQIGSELKNEFTQNSKYIILAKTISLMLCNKSEAARNSLKLLNPILRQAWLDYKTSFSRFNMLNEDLQNKIVSHCPQLDAIGYTSKGMNIIAKKVHIFQVKQNIKDEPTRNYSSLLANNGYPFNSIAKSFYFNFEHLVTVLDLDSLSDEDLNDLTTKFINLKKLKANGYLLTNSGFSNLSKLKQLESLVLPGKEISDEGLIHIKSLSELRYLDLRGSKISDEGLLCLEDLKKLRILDLSNCQRLTDKGLGYLAKFNQLAQILCTSCERITKDGVSGLQKTLPNLQIFSTVR